MKVLMPVLHYWPVIGGLENWTQNIAERLSEKAGVFVVTGKVAGQLKKEIKNKVDIARASLFSLKDLSHSSPMYILAALPFIFLKSLAIIKREKIDILHCQGFLSSFLGFCLAKLTGIPYVTTVQRLETKSNPLKNFIYRNASVCIAASRAISDNFKAVGVKNVEIIPNGIDLARFKDLNRDDARKSLGLNNEFVIMTVARLEKVKGINYLIRAMAAEDLRKINYKLLIIGEGSEGKVLRELVKGLNLGERVAFLGEVSNDKIPGYLAAADCFVLPSLKEGFGIVVLEAQAAGLPVVASRVGGILDLIEDGKTGLLVASADAGQVAAAINRVYSGWRPNGLNLEKYDWQNIAEKVYETYIRYGHISA